MLDSQRLPLTVNVPADDWAASRSRIAYLENLLLGVADRDGLDAEWHDVERLAGLWGGRRREPEPEPIGPVNVVPAWVIPFLRALRGEAAGHFGDAWALLPHYLPAGVAMPGEREAAIVLLGLGLA